MKKVIITGGNSFIGTALTKLLLNKEYIVYAVVRPGRSLGIIDEKLNYVYLEMSEYHKMDQMIDSKCDCYISLAWEGTRNKDRDNAALQDKNLKNSMVGIDSAVNLGCSMIISVGSQAEYGIKQELIAETTSNNPKSEYGKKKLKLCQYLEEESYKKGFNFREPRFFSLYGPGDYSETLIMSTLKKLLKNEPCNFSSARHNWNYLYIEDGIKAIAGLMETNCPNGTYNVASYDTRPLKEFIYEMKEITKSRSVLNFAFGNDIYCGPHLDPSIEKITKLTNWKPETNFERGIKGILESSQFTDSRGS